MLKFEKDLTSMACLEGLQGESISLTGAYQHGLGRKVASKTTTRPLDYCPLDR